MSLKVDFRIILEAIVQCMVAVEKASRPPVRSSTGAVVQVQLGILPSKIIEIYNQQIARLSQLKNHARNCMSELRCHQRPIRRCANKT